MTITAICHRSVTAMGFGMCCLLLGSAIGCGQDEYVRGSGSIDVPRPSGMITPEEAATVTGETPAPSAAP